MPEWLHLRLISEQAALDDEDFANLGVWICPFSNYNFQAPLTPARNVHEDILILTNTLPSRLFLALRGKAGQFLWPVFPRPKRVQCSIAIKFSAAAPYFSRDTALSSRCRFKSALVETPLRGEWPNRGCRLGYRREYIIADQSDAHRAHLGNCLRTRSF